MLLISIPAVNLFTHGTHITVAHSMGTTIGINTLILLSSVTYILESNQCSLSVTKIRFGIRLFQTSFVLFWGCLLLMGVRKAHWTFFDKTLSFGQFQDAMHGFYVVFVLFGLGIFIGLYRIVFELFSGLRLTLK